MAFCPTLMRADTIGLSFTGGTGADGISDLTVGYAFTLSGSVLVTQFGIWDQGNDGLNTSHGVDIWTSTGTLVATTTIPSGTGATLTNGFRYVSIASILLPAGSYTIGGFSPPTAIISYIRPRRLHLLPGLLTMVLGPILDSRFRRVTSIASRTATSARISNLDR